MPEVSKIEIRTVSVSGIGILGESSMGKIATRNTTVGQIIAANSRKNQPSKGAASQPLEAKNTREQLFDKLIETIPKATGTRTEDFGDRIIQQVGSALVWPMQKDSKEQGIKAITAITELEPQSATEAMLATQMIAAHDAALMFMARATSENKPTEIIDANVQRATRLMRLFNEQLEAMAKLKGKSGQQKVTVEHVHVYTGGQAIVGSVTGGGVGGHGGNS